MTILQLPLFARVSYMLNQCIKECIVNVSPKNYWRKFNKHRYYATAVNLKVDAGNVVSSRLPDISDFENIYLHDFIWEKVGKWSNHTALICADTGRSYTYGQLRKACGKLAMSLRKNQLLPGDTIAIILPNIPEFAIIALAANEAGLRTTLINPAYTIYEIKRQLENADVQAIFTIPTKYADIKTSIEKNSKIKLPIVIVNDGTNAGSISGTIQLDDLMRDDIEDFSISQKTGISYEDTVLLPYSSGTTGLPKGVETSHKNIVANIIQNINPTFFPGIEANEHHQDIIPLIVPVHHFYGLIIVLYCYLRIGAKLVCLPKFSMDGFMKLLENHRCTALHVVPPIVQMMIYNERITSRHVESIRLTLSGAAPLGEKLITKFQNRFPNDITFIQGYGATELSPLAAIGNANVPSISCGCLISNTQMRIVSTQDDTLGRNLGPNEVGEIYIRGPQVMKGYYKNPKATADTMDDDWYKTGDLGYYTEDGVLYVQGRSKELIKVKGYQVAPTELEEVIRHHDNIQDVAVVGVTHENYGEIPKAFVVPKSGVKINENELKEFVAKRVAKYKQLGYIQVIESIPKSVSGKILRRELQNL
ncbi:PREDICTED: 4-coumarate--CoA ligase [Cyphomyrmex costatus]|uniref:Putative 4-coumarate--CoA ligase 3 n=1 Tax=Cyphomyrmex costatus TaxID=456900 RepID=A0A195C543_9HYME|nr:PREDICTED: 4-coumarate--CoA ligase [Cyphomyrmex costatus]KYM95989.1 putative 4-coumarate--CoA ligase 3 [Cyphomyrmex costatus]